MRLDKFLKVSRLIKRRTLAKELCDGGKVLLNGRVSKAGAEIKLGDELNLDFGHKNVKVKVLAIKENIPAKEAKELYEVLE